MTRLDQLTAAEQRLIRRGHYTPAHVRAPPVGGAARVPDQPSTAPGGPLFSCHHCPATFTQFEPAQRHTNTTGHARLDYILTAGQP